LKSVYFNWATNKIFYKLLIEELGLINKIPKMFVCLFFVTGNINHSETLPGCWAYKNSILPWKVSGCWNVLAVQ